MPAADDEPPTPSEGEGRRERRGDAPTADGAAIGTDEGTDRPARALEPNIDRVADKVKGLLRRER